MEIAVYSTRTYDRRFLDAANAAGAHQLRYLRARLEPATVPASAGCPIICVFVNDTVDAEVLRLLWAQGVRLVVLRSAGFSHVDLGAAAKLGMAIARVPEYSPYAVAEHTAALMLTLNRRTHRAHARVREGNFNLDGLMGFDLHGKTVGLVGTGKIGACFAKIMAGFGCTLLGSDPHPNPECLAVGLRYVPLQELLRSSDVISLHCPLTPGTRHLIDEKALREMRPGAMLLNTSRGAVIDTPAVITALKEGRLGSLGIDVYEEEADLFFRDLSSEVLHDDVFARLLTFSNVLITGHQAFFTVEALTAIAETTLENVATFIATGRPRYPVGLEKVAG
jgi:D-lactate dehydrogenase